MRHGDEQNAAPFFATLAAVIPKIQSFFWDYTRNSRENTNLIKVVKAQNFMVNFLHKGSLYYICVTNNKHIAPDSKGKSGDDTMFLDDRNFYNKHK